VNEVPSCDAVIDATISVVGSFLRATDALTGAIGSRNAVAICEALERLGRAREQALALVGLEPVAL
jgi:hypothetical protein